MALKKLFGVALLLGVAAACGGTSGKVAHDADEDQPPGNSDQPPVSSDQPSGNEDQPPSGSSRPPSNPDSPGGGRLQELCDKLCEFVNSCDLGMGESEATFCEEGSCRLPAGAEAQVPCVDQAIDFLDCVLTLTSSCSETAPPPSDSATERCRQSLEGLQQCQGDYEPPDTEGPNNPDPPDPIEGSCTPTGGCENCLNDCAECLCDAGTDEAARSQCALSTACTQP